MNLDPDKVLPILNEAALDRAVDPEHCYRVQLGRVGMEDIQAVAIAQRDADLARITPLMEALQQILDYQDVAWGEYGANTPGVYGIAHAALRDMGLEI